MVRPNPPAAVFPPDAYNGQLTAGLDDLAVRLLVNADAVPKMSVVMARCEAFAAEPDGLIVILLPWAAPGLEAFATHAAVASLWAFTRQAALAWATRGIRVNAIGLGSAPFGPDEAEDQAGRGATEVMAPPAGIEDIVRTVRAMAELPSMTGQNIRLGF